MGEQNQLKGDGKGIVEITNIGFEPLLTSEEFEIAKTKQLKAFHINKLKNNIDKLYAIYDYHNSNEEIIFGMILDLEVEILNIRSEVSELNATLKLLMQQNIDTLRELHTEREFVYKDQYRNIAIFESALTRAFGCYDREYSDRIVSVVTYYTEIFENIMTNGFMFNGSRYIFFTAGAGQTRCKKSTFVKEEDFIANKSKLFCGLTEEIINNKGGMNTNKYLAYTSLCQSNSEIWESFDIDRAIVVEDIEFNLPNQKVRGIYVETKETREEIQKLKEELESLNKNTSMKKTLIAKSKKEINDKIKSIKSKYYSMEDKVIDIPIPFTDGFGIILEEEDSSMARLPFIKGLMSFSPYEIFKKVNNIEYGVITIEDIYGKVWNIDKDNIKYIFTKSQFKMYKYYKDWDEYKANFKKYNCEACRCNVERKVKLNALTNYQVLQTLTTEMTDEDICDLAKEDLYDLAHVGDDYISMLNILGANEKNARPTHFQKSLMIYPEMLKDKYVKNTLCDKKNSMIKKMRSGKFNINGTYTFIVPDVLACMQWWFLGERELTKLGVLKENEVSCSLFKNKEELDCLRSPHLDHAHCIRNNKVLKTTKQWFKTKAIYVGVLDNMSKLLMYDNDGDRALVHNNKTIIKCAKQFQEKYNMLPNYYEMAKANSQEINTNNLFNGILSAYHHGNIGTPSNDITGIWSKLGIDSSKEEIETAIKCIAIKTAIVNFTIDYAKTLWMSEVPKQIGKQLSMYCTKKTPFFFQFAKDKKKLQCEEKGGGCIDRIYNIVPDKQIRFKNVLGRYSYTNLMSHDVDIETEQAKRLISLYMDIHTTKKIRYKDDNETMSMDNVDDTKQRDSQFEIMIHKIKKELLESVDGGEEYIVNVLVKSLKNEISKSTLWDAFGERLYINILNNVGDGIANGTMKFCTVCGDRFEYNLKAKTPPKYCRGCAEDVKRQQIAELMRKKRNKNNDL